MRTLVLASIVSLAVGCKGKPKPQAAPGSAKVETTQNANQGSDVDLPHGPGTPPDKTTKPIDGALSTKLAAMEFPGFVKDVRASGGASLWVLHQIPSHPVLRASIHIDPCTNEKAECWPLDLATWQGHKQELMQYLPEELQKAPDTTFEIGQTELHGQPLIYTYQLGQVVGGKSIYSHAYVVYYNDGVNAIRVLAEYKDDMAKSKDAMAQALPRQDLENTAKAFLDVYTHAWQ